MIVPPEEEEYVLVDDTLTVLLGAGASVACGDPDTAGINSDYVPPLVNELFAHRSRFSAILAKYEGTVALSDEIRSRIVHGEPLRPQRRRVNSDSVEAMKHRTSSG